MTKTNQQILEEMNYDHNSGAGQVYDAMELARADERERITDILEDYLNDTQIELVLHRITHTT